MYFFILKDRRWLLLCLTTVLLVLSFAAVVYGFGNEQVISGAGPSTKIATLFFKHFSTKPAVENYTFTIPPTSTKHAGGIKASSLYLFGRTGRPLKESEKALNKGEIFLAKVPVAFVTRDDVGVKVLTLKQLENIFLGKAKNWKDFGGVDQPVSVLGREHTEAVFTVLKQHHTFFNAAKFNKIFRKDHEVVSYLKTSRGKFAIGFGAKPNFTNVPSLSLLEIQDMSLGVNLGLVYDLKNEGQAVILLAKKYAQSKEWSDIITAAGYLPPDISN